MEQIVNEIYSLIATKSAIYEMIAERTHKVSKDEASKIVQGELEIFQTRLKAYLVDPKNSVATITPAQGANIFLDVMEMGLSFSPIANHVYVSRLTGTGTSIGYKVTKEGAIYLAQRAGAIDHLSEPVIVWKGEQFSISSTTTGHSVVNHTQLFDGRPSFSLDQMLVGYVYVVYPNGDRELSKITATRLAELRKKSKNQSMYDDESFIETKIIKHALRSVRKEPFIGQSQISDDDLDEPTLPVLQPTVPQVVTAPTLPVTHPLQDPSVNGYQVPTQYQAGMQQVPQPVNTLAAAPANHFQQQQAGGNMGFADPF